MMARSRLSLPILLCLLFFLSNSTQEITDSPSKSDSDVEDEKLVSSVKRKTSSLRERRENFKSEPVENIDGVMREPGSKSQLLPILKKAGKKGLGGGVTGAMAGVVQVLSLMWLRTIINHQCRYGTTMKQAIRILYNEGGIPRFYRGLSFALIQAPLSRFGSTAANDGVNALLSNLIATKNWGAGRSTIVAAFAVGLWSLFLMPIDTCKTVLQVESFDGFKTLLRKVKDGKINALYQGALANTISKIVAHYPWFFTYNILNNSEWFQNFITILRYGLLKNALVGFLASIASDTVSNMFRVIKTTKQALAAKTVNSVSYIDVVQMILVADGWKGLLGRGLRTRILSNGLQSIMFVIVWRGLKDKLASRSKSDVEEEID